MIRGGTSAARAGVLVPETAMHEDNAPTAREYEIGSAWQITSVKAIAVTHAVHEASHEHFRCRVDATNTRHELTPRVRRQMVSH